MLGQGDLLREYEIQSVIGRGGFGVVYKGKHQELGIDVAIKEYFPPELSVRQKQTIQPSNPELQESFEDGLNRFLDEAKQLEKFRDHPNIVTCRDLFRANGTAYMVMDYIFGLPLSTLLEQRESQSEPFTEQDLLSLIPPLLNGLRAVHEQGVCHRDIKPSNILVRRSDGVPVLIDFGAAKHEISKQTKSFAPYTDGYAAMEQVGEGRIGPWTDIYGLGAVMWRVVAGGNPPFTPPNPLPVQKRAFEMMQGQSDPLPSASEIGKDQFSAQILRAIDNCLTINVNERTKSCGELLDALNSSVELPMQTNLTEQADHVEDELVRAKREKVKGRIGLVMFGVAAVIALVAWISSPSQRAKRACAEAIELRARYGFEWERPKFNNVRRDGREIILSGRNIRMQNGFGAYSRMYYTCTYDLDFPLPSVDIVDPND